MNSDDFLSDVQLDQLLDSATWPTPDDAQLSRLEDHWQNVRDEHQPQTPTNNRWNRHLPWILAAAASLLIGCAIWLTSDWAIEPVESTSPERIANSVQPTTELDIDASEIKGPEKDRNEAIVNNTPAFSPAKYLDVMAKARDRRQTKTEATVSTYDELAKTVATFLGRSPLLAATVQTLVRDLDQIMVGLRSSRQISRREWNNYLRTRRDWEKWAWGFADSGTSRHQMGSLRFAIAVSTDWSLNRLEELLPVDGLGNDAAFAIASLGNARRIDRGIRRSSSPRAQRRLMTAMLNQRGRQPALLFLRYLRDPELNPIAVNIANSTDRLPTDVWLAVIAKQEKQRYDAALAVSQVCDQRIVNGLIQMASQPTTSRPAMMALIKSSCTDAQNFIAWAETDRRYSGSVSLARRKLQQLKMESSPLETQNDDRRMYEPKGS